MSETYLSPAYGLPDYALRTIGVLEDAGFEAWAVGGWVRDAVLGATPHDVDVTTSARWQDAARAFRAAGLAVHETGIAHGTITVVVGGNPVEVTTYRVEGAYTDHRHPDEVIFVDDVRLDLARRDFTINAMAYHPERGLLDPFDGCGDLARGLIRAVGDPYVRFDEDALRVLRAVRFACRLGFAVEKNTQSALIDRAPSLSTIAAERVGQELDGIIRGGNAGRAIMDQTEVMCAALPEMRRMVGFDQRSPYHAYDVLEHTSRVCRAVEEFTGGMASPALRWAALLHDMAKPACFTQDENGRGHFYGHPKVGAQMAEDILRRLAMPRELVGSVRTLVRLHDHAVKPTGRSVRRTLMKFEAACPGKAPQLTLDLLDLKRADAVSKVSSAAGYAIDLDRMTAAVRRELAAGAPYRLCDLAITGGDIIAATGIRPGPAVGAILREALEWVVNGDVENTREALLARIVG